MDRYEKEPLSVPKIFFYAQFHRALSYMKRYPHGGKFVRRSRRDIQKSLLSDISGDTKVEKYTYVRIQLDHLMWEELFYFIVIVSSGVGGAYYVITPFSNIEFVLCSMLLTIFFSHIHVLLRKDKLLELQSLAYRVKFSMLIDLIEGEYEAIDEEILSVWKEFDEKEKQTYLHHIQKILAPMQLG